MVCENREDGTVEVPLELEDGPDLCSHLQLQYGVIFFVGLQDPRDEVDGAVILSRAMAGKCGLTAGDARGAPASISITINQCLWIGARIMPQIILKLPSELRVQVP